MELNIKDFIIAYKKLKKEIYYDNINLNLRKQLAEFESLENDYNYKNIFAIFAEPNENYAFAKIKKLFEMFSEQNEESKNYFESLISKTNIIVLPKSFEETSSTETNSPKFEIYSNTKYLENLTVDRLSIFIECPVELHILNVIWVLKFGYKLEDFLSKSVYGNRILLNKHNNPKEDGPLYKPYIKQYRNWRDKSIDAAKDSINKDNSVTLFNIDIKDCYHSVRINLQDLFKNTLNISENEKTDNYLSSIFLSIHKKYKEFFFENSIDIGEIQEDEYFLPIGLYSSSLLCNWYLSDFDNLIIKKLRPIYYGRYVDDISIVINDDFFQKNANDSNTYFKEIFKDILLFNKENIALKTDNSLHIQKSKLMIYHFDSDGPTSMIDKFKEEILKNSSEFRFIPNNDSKEQVDFESSFFEFSFDDSKGKLKTLKDFKETRYGISIFLSKKISFYKNNIVDDSSKKISAELAKLFSYKNIFNFYALWEKLFTFFVITNDTKYFIILFKKFCETIYKVKYREEKIENRLIKDLYLYLITSIEIATSLNLSFLNSIRSNFEIISKENYIHAFMEIAGKWNFNIGEINNYISIFAKSNLLRHHYLKLPLINYSQIINSHRVSLFDPYSILINCPKEEYEFNIASIIFSPRRVKLYEIIIWLFTRDMYTIDNFNNDSLFESKHYNPEAIKYYYLFNYKLNLEDIDDSFFEKSFEEQFDLLRHDELFESLKNKLFKHYASFEDGNGNRDGNGNNRIIEVHTNSNPKNVISIGIANININEKLIENNIKNIPFTERSYDYNNIIDILNQAEKEKSDYVLLPENCISLMNLPTISQHSARSQRTIIYGTEHIHVKDFVYNFIVCLLPLRIDDINDAIPLIRIKNHYSPAETILIKGHSFKIPDNNKPLYFLINHANHYFSFYYCFELADLKHRALFKSKVDSLFASEWNKDVNYFSNIVESTSRDLHCFFIQSNTSKYGDSRITLPKKTENKNLIQVKGGKNNVLLVDDINLSDLRNFQLGDYSIQLNENTEFKPVPPDFRIEDTRKRINNEIFFPEND